jgi:anthraniloyl-CoA monooxygenase
MRRARGRLKIEIVGGGPAGLYFALLMKRMDPAHLITVHERNRPDDTFGWGVVFSDETLSGFAEADPESHRAITSQFAYWTDIDIFFRGERIRSTGHGFCGIARRAFLGILQRRAEELGVLLRFETEIDPARLPDADLVLAADGANSRVRDHRADRFRPTVDWRRCKFTWLGTDRRLDAFTFVFRENEHGLFQVHAYPFDAKTSTFIVECREEVWRAAGLDRADEAQTVAYLEALFREDLRGHRLLTNRSVWRSFPTVKNATWRDGNVALIGDAAHTAHFSIGSGTKLAMEDAIALADAFRRTGDVPAALEAYEAERLPVVGRFQSAAQTSLEWFENAARHARAHDPLAFAFSLMSRSKRITYDNLRTRDPELVRRVTEEFAAANPHRDANVPAPAYAPAVATAARTEAAPPLFQPFRLRELTLANRLVVSPMCQYSCDDGTPNDWHLVHLGGRAIGGAGLVMAEATHVARDARISPGCAGIYADAHVAGWKRVVDFAHAHSRTRVGLQLAHAGRKSSCGLPWLDEGPLAEGGWPTLAPSALPYAPDWPVPRAMDRADMDRVTAEFVRAAGRAHEAGFDLLELHFAHGYLLGTFLSPLANVRTDEYGGSIGNRLRYPLEVFHAVRAEWPAAKPISVRLSASDWHERGMDGADRIAIGRALKAAGCDVIDVSAGQTVSDQQPVYGRMFQVPFSDEIRNEAGIATMAVGNIQDADQCNTILAAGRADLCVLARPHLADPYFMLHAAARYGVDEQYWPPQYWAVRPRR